MPIRGFHGLRRELAGARRRKRSVRGPALLARQLAARAASFTDQKSATGPSFGAAVQSALLT